MAGNKSKSKDNSKKKRKQQKGLAKWWRETQGELRKVNWPTRKDALQMTKVVLLVMAVMSALFGIVDFLFSRLLGWILA
ncbi:MAG: preprotein translocase subunit SecE [Anaerolineaceae bacterium]|nr:preprotein translocase subunit SecE [Anaerolineaceae bacterium]